MEHLGYGYGSEFQLLRFLGRHRNFLEDEIRKQIHEEGDIKWLDFGFMDLDSSFIGDVEIRGLGFLEELPFVSKEQIEAIQTELSKNGASFMAQYQSWDALFTIGDTLYLVEAKAHCKEMLSACGARRASHDKILAFMKQEMPELDVNETWMHEYYQLANRLATTAFLNRHGIKAKTLCLFFENGYKKKYMVNGVLKVMSDKDTSRAQFEEAIKVEMAALGISDYEEVKDIMTPAVFINANPIRKKRV